MKKNIFTTINVIPTISCAVSALKKHLDLGRDALQHEQLIMF